MAEVNLTNGAGSLLAWAFTGIGAVVLALVFANLGRAYVRDGALRAPTQASAIWAAHARQRCWHT